MIRTWQVLHNAKKSCCHLTLDAIAGVIVLNPCSLRG